MFPDDVRERHRAAPTIDSERTVSFLHPKRFPRRRQYFFLRLDADSGRLSRGPLWAQTDLSCRRFRHDRSAFYLRLRGRLPPGISQPDTGGRFSRVSVSVRIRTAGG